MTVVCVTMHIKNGTVFCAISIINVGQPIGKLFRINWMVNPEVELDYYAMEEPWTLAKNPYGSVPEGSCVDVAKEVFEKAMR